MSVTAERQFSPAVAHTNLLCLFIILTRGRLKLDIYF